VRRAIIVVSLLAAGAARAGGTPPPSCPAGSAWTQTWTQPDPLSGTALTYTLTSPCYVVFDTDFVITARVTDTLCQPPSWPDLVNVGIFYKITDTRLDASNATSVLAGRGSPPGAPGSGGIGYVTAFDGQWLTTVKQHYGPGGTPTDHRIAFSFIPRNADDCSLPGMGWTTEIVGTTTYDPYATSTDSGTPPGDSGSASTGSGPAAPAASSGGCGSSGVAPAFIGLAALFAAARPRRRSS
jgi:hypothetical protein